MNNRGIKYFLAELLIVTLGVSISLFMANLLEQKKSRQTEYEVLSVLEQNLQRDSLLVDYQFMVLEKLVNGASKLQEPEKIHSLDTLSECLDLFCSYSAFHFVTVGFTEITTNRIVLSNDTLYRATLDYYTTVKDLVDEWGEIDKKYVLEDVIPYMLDHFEHLKVRQTENGSFFGFEQMPEIESLHDKGVQNRLVANLIYKQNIRALLQGLKGSNNRLLHRVQQELKTFK